MEWSTVPVLFFFQDAQLFYCTLCTSCLVGRTNSVEHHVRFAQISC